MNHTPTDSSNAANWEKNAEAWTQLSREGYNVSRDALNTPALLELLGPVHGLRGLDVGCGEGDLTRRLAQRGAKMTGLDIAPTFVRHASQAEKEQPLGIEYVLGSAAQLPFADGSFDFVTAMMSLMDMPRPDLAIAEAARVLRRGGVLQFAITHPCFQTARWEWVHDADGRRNGIICGQYFDPPAGRLDVWTFGAAPPERKKAFEKFRIPRFDFTLSWWINTLLGAGFVIEKSAEPAPSLEEIQRDPSRYDERIFAWFWHVRCRRV